MLTLDDDLAYFKAYGELNNKKNIGSIFTFNLVDTRSIKDEEYKNNCDMFLTGFERGMSSQNIFKKKIIREI